MKKVSYVLFLILIIFLIYTNITKSSEYVNDNKSSNQKSTFVYKEIDGVSYPYFNDEEVDNKVAKLIKNYQYQINVIDNKIVSILFSKDEEYQSILYDFVNKKELNFNDITNNLDEFNNIIYQELSNKYPLFIANFIKNNNYSCHYYIKDNEILLYFDINGIVPSLDETIIINLNNQLISNVLTIKHDVDSSYTNNNVYTLKDNKKTVALSFDDGPTNLSKDLVSVLNANHANATFFVVGSKMKYYPDTMNNSLNSGNEYGCHSYNHRYLTKITDEELSNQIDKTINEFKDLTSREMTLVRPPYGSYNSHVLEYVNYPLILWNIDSRDWDYKDKDKNLNEILTNLQDKAIILMHETYKASVETVEELLPILYAKGYQVVTVSKLMEINNKEIVAHKAYRSAK